MRIRPVRKICAPAFVCIDGGAALQHRPGAGHPQRAGAGMAGDAQRQRRAVDLLPGKGLPHRAVPGFAQIVVAGIGGHQPQRPAAGQRVDGLAQRLKQRRLGRRVAPHLLVGVQLAARQLQNGLQVQRAAQQRRRRCDPPALPQVFQGVHRQIDLALGTGALQRVPDGAPVQPQLPQRQRVQHRLAQGGRDPAVVHHLHPARVGFLRRQRPGGGAGARQPRTHRQIHHRVVAGQQLVPQGGGVRRGRLGGGHPGPALQRRVKLPGAQIPPLLESLPVDGEGHRQQRHIQPTGLLHGHPAVGIGHDRYAHGTASLWVDGLPQLSSSFFTYTRRPGREQGTKRYLCTKTVQSKYSVPFFAKQKLTGSRCSRRRGRAARRVPGRWPGR